ncbi:hypothetical protein RYX36_014871 [Vicia faba]
MAESSPSPCLFRSFSVPSDTSCAPHEGNPLRALGESISFGRYMSESLNWEKWSVFTQNRYVEEAEKYSKPGSVAAKKAYFEAHYKRKAAEKAAALVEEANRTYDSETFERNCSDAPAQIRSEADSIETVDEEISKDIVDYQVVNCDGTERCKWDDRETDLEIKSEADSIEITNIEVDKETIVYQVVDCDDTNQCKWNGKENDLEIKSEAGSIEITDIEMNEDTVDYQVVVCDDTNQCKWDDRENDLDVSNVEVAEKVLYPYNDMNPNVESHVIIDNSNQLDHVEVRKNSVISIEEKAPDPGITVLDVLALPVKEREITSSPKSLAKTGADKLPHSHDQRKSSAAARRIGMISGLKCDNSIGDIVEKKRLTARSLRTSINLPSGTGETSKTADAALRSRNATNRFLPSKNSVGSLVENKRLATSSLHMSINVSSGTGLANKTTTASVKPRNGTNFVAKSLKSIGASIEKRLTARPLSMSINLSSGAGETTRTATQASHDLLNQAPANLPSQGRSCLKSSSTTQSSPRLPTKSLPFRFRSEERAIKRKEFLQRMEETKSKVEEKVQIQRKATSSSSTIKNLGKSRKPPLSTNNSKRITEINNRTWQSGTSLSNTSWENASPNIQH